MAFRGCARAGSAGRSAFISSSHCVFRNVFLCLLFTFFFFKPCYGSLVGTITTYSSAEDRRSSELLLHSYYDGTVLRIGPDSETMWSFSSGGVLSSASHFYGTSEDEASLPPSSEHSGVIDDRGDSIIRYSVLDRQFYSYEKASQSTDSNASTIGDIVSIVPVEDVMRDMPHINNDGNLVLGSFSTSAFLIDAASGALVRRHELPGDAPWLMLGDGLVFLPEDPLFIVRKDYSLFSLDSRTGLAQWNMTYAVVYCSLVDGSKHLAAVEGSMMKMGPLSLKPISFSNHPANSLAIPANRAQRIEKVPHPEVECPADEKTSSAILALPSPAVMGALPPPASEYPVVDGSKQVRRMHLQTSIWLILLASVLLLLPLVFVLRQQLSPKQLKVKPVGGKRKRNRKSAGATVHQLASVPLPNPSETNIPATKEGIVAPDQSRDHEQDPQDCEGGVRVGSLFVSNTIIGHGSHGTVVREGSFQNRKVAIKILLEVYADQARREIAALNVTDNHPNVVRCFMSETDGTFFYMALERCSWNLHDFVIQTFGEGDLKTTMALKREDLWDLGGRPSKRLLELMKDIVKGLAFLHSKNFVHRDIKPRNVLINDGKVLRAKLSDMGISKLLDDDVSSFDSHTGVGTSGWQAPEQLKKERLTRSVDMFSLGCVFYFCITGGQHPFGSPIHRDVNIIEDRADLFPIDHLPEASKLIRSLIDKQADKRPSALEVLWHPFFWGTDKQLSFLMCASDVIELEDREENSVVLDAVEAVGATALCGSWFSKLHTEFVENLGRHRRYNEMSVRDLLRVIRNKGHHYRELPKNLKELLGPWPDGFLSYFTSRFPLLLMEVYKVMQQHGKEENEMKRFFGADDSIL